MKNNKTPAAFTKSPGNKFPIKKPIRKSVAMPNYGFHCPYLNDLLHIKYNAAQPKTAADTTCAELKPYMPPTASARKNSIQNLKNA